MCDACGYYVPIIKAYFSKSKDVKWRKRWHKKDCALYWP